VRLVYQQGAEEEGGFAEVSDGRQAGGMGSREKSTRTIYIDSGQNIILWWIRVK
jgi:hypothetical protein